MRALASAFALVPLGAGTAQAAAWTQPAGGGQVIVTGIHSHSDKGFDDRGRTIEIDDYDKDEAYALVEYGITDALTVLAIPSLSRVEVDGAGDKTGLGQSEIGARYRLAATGAAVFSLQGSLRIPGRKRRDRVAQIGATDTEVDLRALAGWNFKLGRHDGFADVQGAYRMRNGGPPNEFRLDATLGLRPAKRLLVMAQYFHVRSDGAGTAGFGKHRYSNLYLSGVYDLGARWSLQLGHIATLSGRNALRERGLAAAIWHRF
jgi:hypothetical protein